MAKQNKEEEEEVEVEEVEEEEENRSKGDAKGWSERGEKQAEEDFHDGSDGASLMSFRDPANQSADGQERRPC